MKKSGRPDLSAQKEVFTEEMTKKQLTLEVIERLKKEYPEAGCTLDYDEAWKLLVSVRLAAQCTDARVNVVVEGLYKKYPTVEALAEADVDDIEAIVRPCGLGRSKARDISACMKMLRDEYGGKILPGKVLYLKFPGKTSPELAHMKLVFQMFPGTTPVKMVMADTRKVYGTEVLLHKALLQEARETLGEVNVVVK